MITFEAKEKIHTVATLVEELTALIEAGLGERYVVMPAPKGFESDYEYVFISRGVDNTNDATHQCVFLESLDSAEEDEEVSMLLLD